MAYAPPPTLPAVVVRLLAPCAEGQCSLTEMVRVIEADPAISSRVLRLANSAYYGFSRKVDTLERAVHALGGTTVLALALGHSVLKAWEGRTLPAAVEGIWVHSYLCALGSRHLAQRLSRVPYLSHPDTLFLTGLLHDMGKILFLAQDPEAYRQALEHTESKEALLDWERGHFGADHGDSGGDALDAWQMPFSIAAVVRYHHRTGLRAELTPDWEVLRSVDWFANGAEPSEPSSWLPEGLVSDLTPQMERFEAEAKAFYQVIQ